MRGSEPAVPIAVMLALIRSNRAPNVRTTPLGVPVVPEVNNRSAGSSGLSAGVTLGAALGSHAVEFNDRHRKIVGLFTAIDKEHGGIREVDDVLKLA